jgi:hypothetical protein
MGTAALAARTRVRWARALSDRGRTDDVARARRLLADATAVANPLGLVSIARAADQIKAKLDP